MIKKKLNNLLIILMLTGISCVLVECNLISEPTTTRTEIPDSLTCPKVLITQSEKLILSSSGSLYNLYKAKSEGINYDLCISDDGRLIEIQTSDSLFRTAEGVQIVSDLHSIQSNSKIKKEVLYDNTSVYYKCESGWHITISQNKNINYFFLYDKQNILYRKIEQHLVSRTD